MQLEPQRSAPWWRDDGWLAVAGPALIFLGHALYGAMLPQAALALSLAMALLLGACLLRPRLRAGLLRLDGLVLPGVLFAAVIAAASLSLTPFAPGGPHPIWAYLDISPGAATVDKSGTLLETLKLLGLGCVFLVGAATGASDARARLALHVLLALGAALGAWAFLAFIAGGAAGKGRLEASFLSANTAGTVFAALFVLTAGPVASRLRSGGPHLLSGAAPVALAGLLFIVCLFMTASRGAFLGAASGLAAFGLLLVFGGRVQWRKVLLLGGGTAVALGALMAVVGDLLLSRLFGETLEFASRTYIVQVHWQAFLASPLTGYGLGSFDLVNRMLLDAGSFEKNWSVRAAHNIYLAWLEQAGLLGALPMFACVGAIMLTTARKAFRRSRMTSLLFAVLGADVVFLAHGATDFALEMFSVAAMWAYLLGLQFSLAQGSSGR